jgi:hypothetical protein
MATAPARWRPLRLPIGVALGALAALLLIGYGVVLVPTTSLLSVVAAALVLMLYAVVGWTILPRIEQHNPVVLGLAMWAGLLAGVIFVVETLLEYSVLPADNTAFGLIEFGLVFLIYAGTSGLLTYRRYRLREGVLGAVVAALLSSLIWCIITLAVFYLFYGSARQTQVFCAEGNYEDFQRSGMSDFNAFIMEDFLGATFFHLLLGPLLASLLGLRGGLAGKGIRWLRRS